MCKVSFILPTYNAEKTIDRCINSIMEQTYTDWEIICCDDCSTDKTLEKLHQWQSKDSRIKVLQNTENRRAAFSRNRCIQEAKGEYIAQIDDDDCCAPNRLAVQVEFLDTNPYVGFVGSFAYLFDEKGVWGTFKVVEKPEKEDLVKNSCFINPSVMLRRSVLDQVNGYRVAKETRRTEDYDLFMRMYSKGIKGYNIQIPLIYYYRGENSFPKCKYEFRIDEAKIRYKNFKALGLLPKSFLYVIKPLIVGLIPMRVIEKIKKIKNNR